MIYARLGAIIEAMIEAEAINIVDKHSSRVGENIDRETNRIDSPSRKLKV